MPHWKRSIAPEKKVSVCCGKRSPASARQSPEATSEISPISGGRNRAVPFQAAAPRQLSVDDTRRALEQNYR
jgi:hypothetical protein